MYEKQWNKEFNSVKNTGTLTEMHFNRYFECVNCEITNQMLCRTNRKTVMLNIQQYIYNIRLVSTDYGRAESDNRLKQNQVEVLSR